MTTEREPTPIGRRIRQLREQHGWSQVQLAYRAGTAPNVISRVEIGAVEPTLTTLRSIAGAFGVEVTDLLNGDPKVVTG
jgi:transcriptional regulator with XRE-family HTH domain